MWHLKKFRNVAKGTQKSVLWVTSASVGNRDLQDTLRKLTHVVLMYGPMSVRVLIYVFLQSCKKQDSKELSPRPLANAPKAFNSKKTL